jgi:thiol-disulfide isomerase/thioredoxin
MFDWYGGKPDVSSKHTLSGKKIDDDDHKKAWDQGQPLHVLFFWDQCGPCHATLPHWEALNKAGLPPGSHALQVESKEKDNFATFLGPEVASHIAQISGYPTFMKLQKGKAPEHHTGNRTTDAFKQWITGQKGGRRITRRNKVRRRRRTRYRR